MYTLARLVNIGRAAAGRTSPGSAYGLRHGAGANHLPSAGCTAARSSSAATGGSSMPDSKGASALDAGHQEDTEPLYLPAPEEGATAVLDVSTGATVKLDHLGPLVVGKDGSLARIDNWTTMADIERENTLRILCKRNRSRLEALRGKETTSE